MPSNVHRSLVGEIQLTSSLFEWIDRDYKNLNENILTNNGHKRPGVDKVDIFSSEIFTLRHVKIFDKKKQ